MSDASNSRTKSLIALDYSGGQCASPPDARAYFHRHQPPGPLPASAANLRYNEHDGAQTLDDNHFLDPGMTGSRKQRSKRDSNLAKIEEYKSRFRRMSTDRIRERLNQQPLIHEAQIALRHLLKEREATP